ncbi:dUTP diphosphatase [Psychrobacillus sp. OK032]|uniref:dUTP diphosphatase n=1 Tax=Psychrobacillus sp. OK032 TaxID=1884358 RepID=UPI002100E6ED|nr:deoxyuridine 5'-triphosphate nucleotidohydrolase [Psychrobacillus sp. OK032]
MSDDAVLPTKAHANDSGYDLVASEDIIVEPGATVVVKTGIAVQLPPGYEAVVRPRSGITSRTKLRVAIGTIDNGYTSEIGVIVDNIAPVTEETDYIATELSGETAVVAGFVSEGSYQIRKNDRIAQLVITKLPTIEAVEITELGESERGNNGFGSSGVSV